MEVTGTLNAYMSSYSRLSPADLEKPGAIKDLGYHAAPKDGESDYWVKQGYTLVGTAVITFTPMGRREIVDNKVEALRNEAASIRAEATAKCTKIEGQIQQLLCIENSPSEPLAGNDDDDFPF